MRFTTVVWRRRGRRGRARRRRSGRGAVSRPRRGGRVLHDGRARGVGEGEAMPIEKTSPDLEVIAKGKVFEREKSVGLRLRT